MASRLKELQNRAAAIVQEMDAIQEAAKKESRSALSEDEQRNWDALEKEATEVDSALAREKRLQERVRALEAIPDPNADAGSEADRLKEEERGFPKVFKRNSPLKYFKGEDAEKRAYMAGQWLAAALFGRDDSARWCKDNGIELRTSPQSEGVNSQGGFLVPDVLANVVIDLKETYGVFRREARVWPMSSDSMTIPRRTAGLTTYYVSENSTVTDSRVAFDGVQLSTKKLAALVLYPTELSEDSVISLADFLSNEIAWGFAKAEDSAGFIGDGTSTYGGITGAAVKINDGTHAASIATAAATHTGFATLTIADFEGAVGILPQYAAQGNPKWYISRAGFSNSMQALMYAAGGNTVDMIAGGTGLSFLGYPVVISQVLNSTLGPDASKIKCLFGDLSMAATFGDRRGMTLKSSSDRYFELDQMAILGTERYDINVHDLGDGSTAGPLVALKTPGS